MEETLVLNSIGQVHRLLGLERPKHPLVTVVRAEDIRETAGFNGIKVVNQLYQITLKSGKHCGQLQYGRNLYDYEEGTLIFLSPGQVVRNSGNLDEETMSGGMEGWTLGFHPDLIRKSSLSHLIDRYSFFSYASNEALHLSDEEKRTLEEIIQKVVKEYSQNLDRHSQHLIIANIKLLLDYCLRFYDRQFITRENLNLDVVTKFERLLRMYYQTENEGLPTVRYCGENLGLSPNYLSDLLRKVTGKSAQEHIHLFIMEKAKNTLLNSQKSISEIGYELGFGYPQHFSSLFKSKTGLTPSEFRSMN